MFLKNLAGVIFITPAPDTTALYYTEPRPTGPSHKVFIKELFKKFNFIKCFEKLAELELSAALPHTGLCQAKLHTT